VKTGDSVKFPVFHPLSRAPVLFIWHVNLGLAPQALCLRLLSQAKKYHSISTIRAKPIGMALHKKSLSLRSRRKHKAWGASPRIRSSKDTEARENGRQREISSPFTRYRGLPSFLFGTLTWGLRPRLYAYACCRRLRNIIRFQTFRAKPIGIVILRSVAGFQVA
jgi:hypothetical protein